VAHLFLLLPPPSSFQSHQATKHSSGDDDPVLKATSFTSVAMLWGFVISLFLMVSVSYIVIVAASGSGGTDLIRELVERI